MGPENMFIEYRILLNMGTNENFTVILWSTVLEKLFSRSTCHKIPSPLHCNRGLAAKK
jgi:hypothetical protein